jgi:DNA-binding MarR family transcriptional regulator
VTAAAAAHGLTLGEYDVLAALRRAGEPYELTPTQLRRELLLSSGGVSNIVRGLTERGLAERRPWSGDRRSNSVRLCPEGARAAEHAVVASAQAQARVLGRLPAEQAHSAAQLLAGMRQ